uniref:Uncharacterized protein n=1 Tax=Anguilla anguilla TaxID=7936 RepID=A0A0E9TNA9_ANGAN
MRTLACESTTLICVCLCVFAC